jgi:hypothetical protein
MFAALLWIIASFLSATLTLPAFAGNPRRGLGKTHEFVLEGLGVSPFVEKVRWALDKLGVDYVEEQDYGVIMFFRGTSVPALHYVRKGEWSMGSMTNSADILCYLDGRFGHAQGAFLRHSPESIAAERTIDVLMESIRRLVYYHILVCDNGAMQRFAPVLWGANEPHVPRWQKLFGPLLLPLQRFLLVKLLRLDKVCVGVVRTV